MQQAAAELGVSVGASEEEIRVAYKVFRNILTSHRAHFLVNIIQFDPYVSQFNFFLPADIGFYMASGQEPWEAHREGVDRQIPENQRCLQAAHGGESWLSI
jgi:hypothetical protein